MLPAKIPAPNLNIYTKVTGVCGCGEFTEFHEGVLPTHVSLATVRHSTGLGGKPQWAWNYF